MKKSELRKEPYEVPRIDCLFAEVEKGFVGSPDGSAGFGDGTTIGDSDDDGMSTNSAQASAALYDAGQWAE